MAKLPGYKRIFTTDYAEEFQQMIETLSGSVNIGFEALYDALNKKLSFKDNFINSPKDINVTVDANGDPRQTTSFVLDSNSKVIGLEVIFVSPRPINAPYIDFTQDNKTILVSNISGLASGTKYLIRVIPHA